MPGLVPDIRRTYISLDIDGTLIPGRTEDGRAHTADDVVHFAERNPALLNEFQDLLGTTRARGSRVVLNTGRDHDFGKIVAEVICGDAVDAIVSEVGCGTSLKLGKVFEPPKLNASVRPQIVEALNLIRDGVTSEVIARYGGEAQQKRFMISIVRPAKATIKTYGTNVRRILYDRLPSIAGLVQITDAGVAIDVVPNGADKGRALTSLIAMYGERRKDVRIVAAGDSDGDLPVFIEADAVIVTHESPRELRSKLLRTRTGFLMCTGRQPHLYGVMHELRRVL